LRHLVDRVLRCLGLEFRDERTRRLGETLMADRREVAVLARATRYPDIDRDVRDEVDESVDPAFCDGVDGGGGALFAHPSTLLTGGDTDARDLRPVPTPRRGRAREAPRGRRVPGRRREPRSRG